MIQIVGYNFGVIFKEGVEMSCSRCKLVFGKITTNATAKVVLIQYLGFMCPVLYGHKFTSSAEQLGKRRDTSSHRWPRGDSSGLTPLLRNQPKHEHLNTAPDWLKGDAISCRGSSGTPFSQSDTVVRTPVSVLLLTRALLFWGCGRRRHEGGVRGTVLIGR